MNSFKAHISRYFFLLLMVWVQLGSTGFRYYENSCSGSKNSTFTLKQRKCCCFKSHDKQTKDKHLVLKGKCCVSIEHLYDSANDFPATIEVFNFEKNELLEIVIAEKNSELNYTVVEDNYNYLHPPDLERDIRIVIQSFQI